MRYAGRMRDHTPWHRLFGIALTDLFTGRPWRVELEKELALKSQRLDVLIIERLPGAAAVTDTVIRDRSRFPVPNQRNCCLSPVSHCLSPVSQRVGLVGWPGQWAWVVGGRLTAGIIVHTVIACALPSTLPKTPATSPSMACRWPWPSRWNGICCWQQKMPGKRTAKCAGSAMRQLA